jgi:RNA polymerase sigma factor (sigma-70 family)
MNDSVLMSAKQGDSQAMNALLSDSQRYIRKVVSGLIGTSFRSKFDVSDMVQDVLIVVFRDLGKCNAENWKQYLGWLSFVARNTVYKEIEKLKALKRTTDLADSFSEDFDAAGSGDSPVDAVAVEETREQMLALAAGMNDRTTKVVELMIDGMSSQEIAEELGWSVGAVYGLSKRFRQTASSLV